jgi:hypothetical protein
MLNSPINTNFGYYLCNGVSFQSKIDALLYSTTIQKPVEWVFYQEIFSKYLWHIEPSETLDQLYDRRSRELREKYDYVILSYSGGADTNNILESFIRQNLHIDEIIINHMSSITKKTTILDPNVKASWNFAAEHELQAIPRLKYIRDKLPKTKITELDVSDMVINSMKEFDDADWVLHRNGQLTIGQLFRYNYFHFREIKKQFDKNLKIGIIVGVDKPKTKIKSDNKFYIYFNDLTTNIATINDFNDEYTNTTVELFYWSIDCLDLLCKQAHVIKKWLEKAPGRQYYWKNPDANVVRLFHERWLRPLIYTTWDNNWFQADKATQWINCEFDSWFMTDDSFVRERELWKRGIDFLEKNLSDFVIYKNDKPEYLKQFIHEYCIGTINSKIII